MLWRIVLIVILFICEHKLGFHLTSDTITLISGFFSIATGAYITILVVLFTSKVSSKLAHQKYCNTSRSTLDELCRRLRISMIICSLGLLFGFSYSCLNCQFLCIKIWEFSIDFLFAFLVSINFVVGVWRTLETFHYLIVLLKSEATTK